MALILQASNSPVSDTLLDHFHVIKQKINWLAWKDIASVVYTAHFRPSATGGPTRERAGDRARLLGSGGRADTEAAPSSMRDRTRPKTARSHIGPPKTPALGLPLLDRHRPPLIVIGRLIPSPAAFYHVSPLPSREKDGDHSPCHARVRHCTVPRLCPLQDFGEPALCHQNGR